MCPPCARHYLECRQRGNSSRKIHYYFEITRRELPSPTAKDTDRQLSVNITLIVVSTSTGSPINSVGE